MKTRLWAWISWIAFLVSAVSEWGLDIDLPLTPALWLVMAAVVFFATSASAQTTNRWTNGSGGKWEIGSNWSPAVTPTNNSLTFVTNTTTKTVTIDAATVLSNAINSCLTISNLTLSAPSSIANTILLSDPGTNLPLRILNFVSISSGGLLVISNGAVQAEVVSGTDSFRDDGQVLLNSPTAQLIATNSSGNAIGYAGQGLLTMSNGFMLTSGMTVGRNAGSQGTLTIAGGTNQLTSAGLLTVGDSASATGCVWVTGGRLDVPSTSASVIGHLGDGQMTVSNGTVSIGALTVGSSAAGTLTLAGGTNAVASFFIVGGGTGKTGAVWLTGGQLLTTNSAQTTLIGNGGVGQLTMSNGTWLGHRAILGNSLGAQGTLTITGGTNEFSSSLSIGEETNSTGAVWVTDTGRLVVTNASTFIGARGTGQMTISNGTFLGSAVLLSTNTTATGTLTVAGGTLACVGPVVIGSATSTGWLTVTNGQFTITNTPATATGVSTGLFVDGSVTVSNGTIHVPSSLVSIGNHGVGSLTVYHGSNDMLSLALGEFTGSAGTLTLNGGTNSIFSDFTLGNGSASTGTIWFNGDRLDTGTANIGWDGVGIMNMSGGVWRATGPVNVGQLNRGTLTVAGGTMIVDAAALVVPHGSTLNGTVWLTGGQVIATNSLISLGEAGGGILTVSNALLSARDVYIATNANITGVGTLTVAAGTNNVYRSLIVGANNCVSTGAVNVAGGRLFVTNATTTALLEVRSGTVTLNSGTLTIDKLVMTNGCGHFNKTGGTLSITTTNLAAGLDADGDGLPNDWEQSHGLSPLDNTGNNGAGGDPDGDGFNNLQEYLAGSNPHSAASVPDAIWINGSSGKWEVGGNWLYAVPPTNNQSVFITNASPKTVTIDAATPTNNMSIANLTLSGNGNTLQITNIGTATPLQIANGATIELSSTLSVKNGAAAIWSVSIDPFGSLSVKDGAATIRLVSIDPHGSLSVTNGSLWAYSQDVQGEVSLVDSIVTNQFYINVASPDLPLTPPAALWMTGGSVPSDFGSVTIGGGGIPGTSYGQMIVSNGFASVNLLNIGNGIVGEGWGTLTCAGGTTEAKVLTIGNGPGSVGTVWLTGGQLVSTNFLSSTTLGSSGGSGEITVSNGTVRLQSLAIGDFGSSGTVTINGGAVYSTNVTLGIINCKGTGTVIVAGGSLFVTNDAVAATLEVLSGAVALNSGTLTVDRLVITNGCGHFVKTGGTFIQNNPPVLGAGLDADGDGLPNDWEQAHGFDPLDATGVNGPNGDPDGDGFTNLQEYQGGTDPQNSNSTPFRITSILQQGNNVQLTWTTFGGNTNVVQSTKGTAGGSYSNNFADISGNIISNVVGFTSATYLDVGGATNFPARYYRVRLVP